MLRILLFYDEEFQKKSHSMKKITNKKISNFFYDNYETLRM